MSVHWIPENHSTVTPYLIVENVKPVLEFAEKAFGAEIRDRIEDPSGKITHAHLKLGNSDLMMGSPQDGNMMPVMLYVYVKDTDQAYKRCLELGATSVMEPSDQFYGDRNASVKDSGGNLWWIATHQETVSSEELQKRAQEFQEKQKK